jgi:hypothetical protein
MLSRTTKGKVILQTPLFWFWRKYSGTSPEEEMSCVPFLGGESQHKEGNAFPKGLERRVVKAGSCEQILQAEIVPLTFLVQFPKGGYYACATQEEG